MRVLSWSSLILMACVAQPTPVVGGHQTCDAGVVRAQTGAGDVALCLTPQLSCDVATEFLSATDCHYAPDENPASACCAPRPAQCAPTDCDCLLRFGPWIDSDLAADAGISFAGYQGPKWRCSYHVWCLPSTDGGVSELVCNPA